MGIRLRRTTASARTASDGAVSRRTSESGLSAWALREMGSRAMPRVTRLEGTVHCTPAISPSAGMHLPVGIGAQRVDPVERAAIGHAEPLLRPAIGPTLPRIPNQRGQLLVGRPAAEALAEIDSRPGVETQEPRAVRGDAAAVAGAAERRGDGRDDPERCPVRKAEALRRSGAMARNRLDSAVTPRERAQHLLLGYDLLAGPACRAAHVHILDKAHLGVVPAAELDQVGELVIVEPADNHGVELQLLKPRRPNRRNPLEHISVP